MKGPPMKNLGWLAVAFACAATVAAAASSSSFLTKAIEGDNSEIALGGLAQTRGAEQGVKNFGAMLQQDHTQAKQQAVAVAQTMGVAPPTQMAPAAVQEEHKLQ